MILNYFNNVKENHQGSLLLSSAHGRAEARTTPYFSVALFAKRKTKFGGGESEGGAGIFTP